MDTQPRKGLWPFREPDLHPSCVLIVWLIAVLASQFAGAAGLACLAVVAILQVDDGARRWLAYFRRARWLFLTLWLVIAYGTSGEAVADLTWMPTYEGVAAANLQVARLATLLACLVWLFARLGTPGLLAALGGLLWPLPLDVQNKQRLVVRLSLVLANLQNTLPKDAWRQMLIDAAQPIEGPGRLAIEILPWHRRDAAVIALAGLALLGVGLW